MNTAVIVAGGSGKRMGASIPKQFLPLAGCPILVHTLKAFWAYDPSILIVLVLPENELSTWSQLSNEWLDQTQAQQVLLASGGLTRCDSVSNGLEALQQKFGSNKEAWVAIHDGVRPFASPKILESAFSIAQKRNSAITCVPVKSSLRIKQALETTLAVDRSLYYEVQTPQTFRFDLIYQAYQDRPHNNYTDDASLFEAQGTSGIPL